jgi:hypothetical protein
MSDENQEYKKKADKADEQSNNAEQQKEVKVESYPEPHLSLGCLKA